MGGKELPTLSEYNKQQQELREKLEEARNHTGVGCDECWTELVYNRPPVAGGQWINADGTYWVYCPNEACPLFEKPVLMQPRVAQLRV